VAGLQQEKVQLLSLQDDMRMELGDKIGLLDAFEQRFNRQLKYVPAKSLSWHCETTCYQAQCLAPPTCHDGCCVLRSCRPYSAGCCVLRSCRPCSDVCKNGHKVPFGGKQSSEMVQHAIVCPKLCLELYKLWSSMLSRQNCIARNCRVSFSHSTSNTMHWLHM
jgi:hypothetical protein